MTLVITEAANGPHIRIGTRGSCFPGSLPFCRRRLSPPQPKGERGGQAMTDEMENGPTAKEDPRAERRRLKRRRRLVNRVAAGVLGVSLLAGAFFTGYELPAHSPPPQDTVSVQVVCPAKPAVLCMSSIKAAVDPGSGESSREGSEALDNAVHGIYDTIQAHATPTPPASSSGRYSSPAPTASHSAPR
jgi:hypothetical protein